MTSEFFTTKESDPGPALSFHHPPGDPRDDDTDQCIRPAVGGAFFFKRISPYAFLISSLLWIMLMLTFWFILPYTVYRRADTFRDRFQALLSPIPSGSRTRQGGRSWKWEEFSTWLESHFSSLLQQPFIFIVPKDAFREIPYTKREYTQG